MNKTRLPYLGLDKVTNYEESKTRYCVKDQVINRVSNFW